MRLHGYVRATVEVDVLIGAGDLERFKARWLGRGYVERFPGSLGLRDSVRSVDIDFVVSGQFPGDEKPKPVAFPSPEDVAMETSPVRVVALPTLIELKLASGMTAPHRLRDLADVIGLVQALRIPKGMRDDLDPYVRARFDELWEAAQVVDEDY